MNTANREISNLSLQEWEKVRRKYYVNNIGMDKQNAKMVLFKFDDIMKELSIEYYLSCGTALGFYRDNNFIEWDDEIDVDIFSENFVNRIDDIKEKFLENDFIVRTTLRGNNTKMSVFYKGIKIAIGLIHDNKKGYRCYKDHRIPSKFYDSPLLFSFDQRIFRLPNPIEEYLKFWYGDWKTPIKSYEPINYLNRNCEWRIQ